MFLTGGQENMMQNKHCTEILKEQQQLPMREECYKSTKIYDYQKEGDIFR